MNDFLDDVADADTIEQLRATNRRLAHQLAAREHTQSEQAAALLQGMRDAFSVISIPPVPPPPKRGKNRNKDVGILLLSDWQLGKVTSSYDSGTVAERIGRLLTIVDVLVDERRQARALDRIAICLAGDVVEGELVFPGQAHLIDASLYRQVVTGAEIIAEVVRWASSRFPKVEVHSVYGNHGFLAGRQRREMHPESNADTFASWGAELATKGLPNVTWNVALDWHTIIDLGDKCRFLMVHGHQVKGWAGIPWYGWARKVLGWGSLDRIWDGFDFDHVLAGHFHTPTSMYLNGRRVWINASTESHNAYAAENLAAAGEPAQWFLVATPGKGVTAEHLISLT